MMNLFETAVSERRVFRGELLDVREDKVRLPNGKITRREYVVHPGAALIVPLVQAGAQRATLILERQFRYPLRREIIEFPAGKIDALESSLHGAQRELREETGYTAKRWAFVGSLFPCVGYSNEKIDIWFARDLTGGAQQPDADEFVECFEIDSEAFFAACRNGEVLDSKSLTAAFWLQQMFSGRWQPQWRTVE